MSAANEHSLEAASRYMYSDSACRMSPGHEPHALKDASKQNASKMLKREALERRVTEAHNYTVTSTYAAQDYAGTSCYPQRSYILLNDHQNPAL
jgi:hypothetical protein